MNQHRLLNVKNVLLIASGKGGVGKTTVAVNLALALHQAGKRVGIFDADIYGPNVPLMLGIHQRRKSKGYVPVVRRQSALPYVKPPERFGLKLMSVGLLMAEDQVINPPPDMAGQVVLQTLRDVIWGELDYLLIDLPPSAGQPQTDLLAGLHIDGAIVVTTPQDLSLLDASRSLQMFVEAEVPIVGVVENMSYFICPNCDEKHEIFQRSSKWRPPALEKVPIIGRIPLTPAISKGINAADPLMHHAPESAQGQAFREITAVLLEHAS